MPIQQQNQTTFSIPIMSRRHRVSLASVVDKSVCGAVSAGDAAAASLRRDGSLWDDELS
jgi:hypothetical protein